MKKINKYIFTIVALALICVYAYADDINDLKKKRSDVQSGISEASGLLKEVRTEKNTTLAEIDALDDELNLVTSELQYVSEQLEITSAALTQTEVWLYDAAQKREIQYEVYKQRVRYQYINGTTGYLEVLLNAEDAFDLLNRVEYVNRIVDNDRNMAARLTETENQIALKLDDIARAKREMEALEAEFEIKHEALQGAIQKKAVYITQLGANEKMYLQQIKDLEADDLRIENLIKKTEAEEAARAKRALEQKAAAAAAAAYQGGSIMWPVPSNGSISSGYGNRLSPVSGKPEFHTGIDIPAAYGANITAAEGGAVISAGWNGGYGNTVVISHGGGLSTLYAHNSSLLVSPGTIVSKGQVIAKAGSTGYSTGNHLHFEVRINGAHTNPVPYLKG